MKLTVDKTLYDLEDLESSLMDLRNLLCLLYKYFEYGTEYLKENPNSVICQYDYYNSLNGACIDAVDNIQELLSIVQENQKAVTANE